MNEYSDDPEFVKSLAKGLAVIEAFDADAPQMTLSRIASKVGLSPGSARRVLLTLTKLGYVGYSEEDKRYFLAARTLQLGYAYLMTLPALNLLQPRLSQGGNNLRLQPRKARTDLPQYRWSVGLDDVAGSHDSSTTSPTGKPWIRL